MGGGAGGGRESAGQANFLELFFDLVLVFAFTQVTSLLYLVPPTTALMAWALFDERLSTLMFVGMALTAAGVWMAARSSANVVVQARAK